MAYQLRRMPDAPWMGRDGHAMLAAAMGAGYERLFVMGGWNPGDSFDEQEYFENTRTADIWLCDSLADLEKGKWTRAYRKSQWSPRHSFGATVDLAGKVNIYGSDVQDGYYVMDHWIGGTPGAFLRRLPTNAFNAMPMADRVLMIPAAVPTIDDTLMIGGQTLPGVVGPPGGALTRHTDIWGYRTADGAWRQVIANCPALPRGAIQKAVVHDIAGSKYLYLFTGGDYDQTDLDSEVWRCPIASIGTAGSWQLVATAPWEGRIYSAIESWDGVLWVIAGNNFEAPDASDNGNLSDIWYSNADGSLWNQLAYDFPHRHAHASAVWNDKIIITGGSADSARLNDVWVIEDV